MGVYHATPPHLRYVHTPKEHCQCSLGRYSRGDRACTPSRAQISSEMPNHFRGPECGVHQRPMSWATLSSFHGEPLQVHPTVMVSIVWKFRELIDRRFHHVSCPL